MFEDGTVLGRFGSTDVGEGFLPTDRHKVPEEPPSSSSSANGIEERVVYLGVKTSKPSALRCVFKRE